LSRYNHGGKIGRRGCGMAALAGCVGRVEQFVVVGRHGAVWRQAFDRERPGDADARLVLVGAVIQEFDVGLMGDRGVDAALALDAGVPPDGVCALNIVGPAKAGIAGDLPLLPGGAAGPFSSNYWVPRASS